MATDTKYTLGRPDWAELHRQHDNDVRMLEAHGIKYKDPFPNAADIAIDNADLECMAMANIRAARKQAEQLQTSPSGASTAPKDSWGGAERHIVGIYVPPAIQQQPAVKKRSLLQRLFS